MIDHSLANSPEAALVFHLKQGFFLYVWPMLMRFVTILGYQSLGRIGDDGDRQVACGFRAGLSGVDDLAIRLGHDGAGHSNDPLLWLWFRPGQRANVAGLCGDRAGAPEAKNANPASDLARGYR